MLGAGKAGGTGPTLRAPRGVFPFVSLRAGSERGQDPFALLPSAMLGTGRASSSLALRMTSSRRALNDKSEGVLHPRNALRVGLTRSAPQPTRRRRVLRSDPRGAAGPGAQGCGFLALRDDFAGVLEGGERRGFVEFGKNARRFLAQRRQRVVEQNVGDQVNGL